MIVREIWEVAHKLRDLLQREDELGQKLYEEIEQITSELEEALVREDKP